MMMDNRTLVERLNEFVYNNTVEECSGSDPDDAELARTVAWWSEGLGQLVLGSLGFIANGVALPILLSKEMSSTFNKLLSCLAIFDNFFIILSVLESIRRYFYTSSLQQYLFAHLLFPLHSMVLAACVYLTLVLALERYRAVCHPVEYYNNAQSSNSWRRVFKYVIPVILFTLLFNLPKCFEAYTVLVPVGTRNEETGFFEMSNATQVQIQPTELRLSFRYVFWYGTVARLIVTGLIPFAALTFLNSQIYLSIRNRRRMAHRPRGPGSAAQKAEETRQAIVLLVIVILFLICHMLRIVLNIHRVFTTPATKEAIEHGCPPNEPIIVLIAASVSHLLLTINSSVNFIIYCFMCSTFRRILYRWINTLCGRWFRIPDANHSDASVTHHDQDSSNNNNDLGHNGSENRAARASIAVPMDFGNGPRCRSSNRSASIAVVSHPQKSNGHLAAPKCDTQVVSREGSCTGDVVRAVEDAETAGASATPQQQQSGGLEESQCLLPGKRPRQPEETSL